MLLHGLGNTWEAWKPVIPALEARHRVIALTLPGHYGGPDYGGDGDASVAGLADQVIATLRAQGIDRAHVVGNSLGGWLAIELARRGFARSVTALSPAGGWRTDADYRAISIRFRIAYALIGLALFIATLFPGSVWLRKLMTKQAMQHGERLSPAEFLASLRSMARTRVFVPLLRTMGRDGPVAALDPGRVPVRVAWGACDAVIPYRRYGKLFGERIVGAEETVVEGVGHVPMYDEPERVVASILDVTTRVDETEARGVAA
ncbi:MAG TPA: alpha/beta fold hydrolase [Caldimonas sp.]|nr:alpha/beta fold hydrolase [Caldimonas sp.]